MRVKVVIVDDENTIRTGLSVLINQSLKYEVIAECKNGQEALNTIVKHSPHIVITDIRMPVMDGFTLITKCRELNVSCKFIILSAHSDFEYARTSLRLGTFDYILKPVDHENLINLLDRVSLIVENEIRDREQLKNQAGLLCLQNFNVETTQNWLLKAKINLDAPQVIAVNFRVPYNEELLLKIKNEIETFLDIHLKGNNIGLIYNKMILLILNRAVVDNDAFINLCNEIRSFIKQNFNISAHLGVGRSGSSLSFVATSYQQAISALSESIYNENQELYFYSPAKQKVNQVESLHAKEKNLLFSAISDCNSDEANRIIDGFFIKAATQKYPPGIVLSFCSDLCQYIEKNISGKNQGDIPDYGELGSLLACNLALDSLKEEIKVIVNHAISQSNNIQIKRYGHIIYQVIRYIHTHYQEELTENKICEQLFINSSYFCKLFKAKIGVSFIKYLTGHRIKKAKELLLNENFNINQIAGLVGYNNPKYFTKVFKDYEGLTPTEYRNNFC